MSGAGIALTGGVLGTFQAIDRWRSELANEDRAATYGSGVSGEVTAVTAVTLLTSRHAGLAVHNRPASIARRLPA